MVVIAIPSWQNGWNLDTRSEQAQPLDCRQHSLAASQGQDQPVADTTAAENDKTKGNIFTKAVTVIQEA
jgi:hypothetical protein